MKITKIKLFIAVITLALFSACQNDPFSFNDYTFTGTYFAWQYPVRTLVLGESLYYDNSNDIKHQFEIKASMAGVYENKKNITVGFEIDPSLADSLATQVGADTVRLKVLPANYYEPITATSFVIPSGSFNGGFIIKLTDAFFNDPLSATNKYILPVRILTSQTDSILKGNPITSATNSLISSIQSKWGIDPRISENWLTPPMNFTIYAIKYINKFHGYYLRRGAQIETTAGALPLNKSYGWEKKYIEYTPYIPKLTTVSLTKLLYADKLALTSVNFKAIIEVLSDNSIVISKDPTSTNDISGSGKFVTGVEEWGGKKRNALYMSYSVKNLANNKTYDVKDTLVIRDNGVAVETFTPIIRSK
ncbi:MAG: DUF5627 domain-containing protein [Paludibacter sp.]